MFRVRISYDVYTDIKNGYVTNIRYSDEIMFHIGKLYSDAIIYDFILIDGNTRPHRIRVVTGILSKKQLNERTVR